MMARKALFNPKARWGAIATAKRNWLSAIRLNMMVGFAACAAMAPLSMSASTFSAVSPDGRNELRLEVSSGEMAYSILRNGKTLVEPTEISLVTREHGSMDGRGAMRNRAFNAPAFVKGRDPSACYGTRCHQLALFPLFEAPVQMFCDSPTQYRTAPECTAFITKVPTVWDETVGVAGVIGKYAAVARRKGAKWWLGAITNWDAREIALPTDFLGSGEWQVEAFEDAPDAAVNAEHYVRRTFTVKAGEPIKVKLAPGGGFAATFQLAP